MWEARPTCTVPRDLTRRKPKLQRARKLRGLERRISEHFYNEAQIMKDILEANLTEEETEELVDFMNTHPYAQIIDRLPFFNKKE
ncbi:hypothetical protein ES703_20544 [subsurface metagenome]